MPKCFCELASDILLLLKSRRGWSSLFIFLLKITSWSCLFGSELRLISLVTIFVFYQIIIKFICFIIILLSSALYIIKISFCFNLNIMSSRHILSNALDESRKKLQTSRPSSKDLCISGVIDKLIQEFL